MADLRRAALGLALLTGCADLSADPFETLAWARDDEADPVPGHRPDTVFCVGPFEENGLVEIDTDQCEYAVLSQPSLRPLRAGERLTGGVTHDNLFADPPATAHVRMQLGDVVLLDATIDIPGPAGFLAIDHTLDARVPAGTPLVVHLHNHGLNAYRLLPLRVVPGL